ncbi:hypothetical protein ACFW04_014240 [Cataglyphis niger]
MYKISHCASIFSAEAWAIYNAILLILDINTSKTSIISDSMSVLKALQEPFIWQNNYLIPLIKAKLEKFAVMKSRRARRAIKEGMATNFEVPYSDLFSVPKEKLDFDFDKYLEHWAKFKSISFFERIYQKNKKPWYYNMSLSRETIVTVSHIRSNHYNLNYSLFRKNLIGNESCSCGHPHKILITLYFAVLIHVINQHN